MLTATSAAAGRARSMWLMKLQSGFRTAVACAIIGCAALYTPADFSTQIRYPSLSYVTAILILSGDATLGDTIRGCWHAVCATLQVLPFTAAAVMLVGSTRFSPAVGAAAVALTAFLVCLPNTSLLTKRLAFGQIVIIYVDVIVHGKQHPEEIMHPVHIAANTGLGAVAAFLALLFPYPRLAYHQVQKLCQSYVENAIERTNLYLNASISESQITAMDLISQAKPLAVTGNRLLRAITLMQDGILWEMPWIRFSKRQFINPADRLQEMETSMRNMEIVLKYSAGSPTQEFTDIVLSMLPHLRLKLERARCFLPYSTTVPEPREELIETLITTKQKMNFLESKSLSAFFFLSCAENFLRESITRQKPEPISGGCTTEGDEPEGLKAVQLTGLKKVYQKWISEMKNEGLLFAFKCSIALGLAVLIGVTFDQKNGFWSGLTIAISFAPGKQAIFTLANARAQGTAIGSVYGVLGAFVFKNLVGIRYQKLADIRFVAVFPWIIFTSFLRKSRMYGEAGGISADIGALLILGRHNYGAANDFAIARLSEVVIGLSCFILVELLLQPVMASTLAKRHLYLSLRKLQDCIVQTAQPSREKNQSPLNFQEFDRTHHHLKSHVDEFEKFIDQAELEPNFWFLPFRGDRYRKLHESLLNVVDLLCCTANYLELVPVEIQNQFEMWKELQNQIDEAFEACNDTLRSSLSDLEKAKILKSYRVAQELQEGNLLEDLENGNCQILRTSYGSVIEDTHIEKFESSYLQQLKKITEDIRESECEAEFGGIQALPALGFCISCLMREVQGAFKLTKELIPWETTLM
ncbi:OLC1v1034807C1 [Oldenlandia corymbosa var. corymbosa]|uniref:OLC1v1034807C1 n=1 Tax=Oldenlandia corymbosa var. corymbosa TaxID=529605 RepID=A0AAV1CSS0_OLDCO|nr:OLC1v1034807C1 [Oldenlandia corymbosa var. corymbosa]